MSPSPLGSTNNSLPSTIAVLIIDDSEGDRDSYRRYLQSDRDITYRFLEAETLEEGLELWRSQKPDIALVDLNLPDGDGLEFLEAINEVARSERTPVIMLTGQGDEKKAVQSMKSGASDYLVKADVTTNLLSSRVKQVLRETTLNRQLWRSQQQQTVIAEIALRIRESLDLAEISNAIVKEVRQFIKADRAAIYQFNPDMSGAIVAEDIIAPWQPCLNVQVEDTCFRDNLGGAYRDGKFFVANDIYQANLTDCHLQLLERFQVRANLVVPILLPNADQRILWGLLIVHQCSTARIWQDSDIQLLQQLSVQLAIGIQQALTYQQVQTELAERKRAEALLLTKQVEIEERNALLEKTSGDLECTIEELRVSTEDLIYQQRQLEYEQIRYQNLFNFAPDGYLVTDPVGRILEANQVILDLLGVNREYIVEKFLAIFVAARDQEIFFNQLGYMLSNDNSAVTWEITLNPYQRKAFPAEIILTKNINPANKQIQLLWIIRNISDRKRAEQELLQLNQSLEAKVIERTQELWQVNKLQRAILDGTDYAIISTDLNGIIQTFNAGAEKMLGYTKEEVVGKVTPEIFHDPQEIVNNITKASKILGKDIGVGFEALISMASQGLIDEEWINIRKDGSRFPISISVTVLKDDNDQPIGTLSVRQDISDRKLAEESLRESEKRFASLASAAPVGIFQINPNNECTYVNGFWSQITGQEPSMALGYGWLQTIHPDDREQIHQQWIQAIEQQAHYQGEGRCIKSDGTTCYYYCQAIPEVDQDGVFTGYIGTLTDISDRKQTELQLQEINDQLLRATKLKDEFLANMSHELRTPLNSILGLSESLQEQILGSLNEKQLKAIRIVESSGEHLLALINDILDLSKISSGTMVLDIASVSVQNICNVSLVFVKQQALQKNIQINSYIPPYINSINIDERRIKQVLINLLTNAVKFTPRQGQVSLLVSVGSGDTWQGEATIPQQLKLQNAPMIVFQVVDNGIGIAAKNLSQLFQPFVQIDSSLNRQYEGTGLGLALVKQIVELHGGQVMVESEIGKGSVFTVALPYEMSEPIAPAPSESTKLESLEVKSEEAIAPLILLAEDNEANISNFSIYLTALNYRLITAKNGEEAIALAKSEKPDIILMDIQMPIMDGLEATRLIRADAEIADIPIIALTALAMEGDETRCLEAGANEYLSKPIKLRQLANKIAELLAPP
ncbi:response regulator [Pseudanabaena yagii]|uniref:histidine kinase n=1 Tax=Pseudanabaena yagii GIHE-NHR1 TaxID=2722753 RepID=A0ABX1LW40_9CYAN|nr:response regulator [Pseudanabaena yagii]NMF59004.1 response regulator [Pseudanabaena yagii GIHE-NHR1]